MKKDEREVMHEALSERNALWVIVVILAIAVAYQISSSIAATGKPEFDYWILAAIAAGLITKAITNIYLDRKD